MWRAASICVKIGPVKKAMPKISRAKLLAMISVGAKKKKKCLRRQHMMEHERRKHGVSDQKPKTDMLRGCTDN
jgi:hypothetical protein